MWLHYSELRAIMNNGLKHASHNTIAVRVNSMDNAHELITEILNSMQPLIEAHKGFAELGEVKGNRVVIYCGGQCIDCSNKCIEDAIREKLPDIEIVFL